MKKRLISALCALLLTGAMLSGCSEMPDKEEKSTVISIWYVQGDLMSEALAAQAELFNQTARDISVELKVYAGESELASALDSARPDMILCGHERAFSLYEQQRLRDISVRTNHRRYNWNRLLEPFRFRLFCMACCREHKVWIICWKWLFQESDHQIPQVLCNHPN